MRIARCELRETQKTVGKSELREERALRKSKLHLLDAISDVDLSTSIHVTSVLASRNSDLATLPRLVMSSGSTLHSCPR